MNFNVLCSTSPALKAVFVLMAFIVSSWMPSHARAEEALCINIDLASSYDSNLGANIEREGLEFATFNGQKISFYTAPYTIVKDTHGRVVNSTATGCFSKKLLRTTNVINIQTFWGDKSDGSILGSATARFSLSTKPQRLICHMHFFEGSTPTRTCQETIEIPLEEIDSTLSAHIRSLERTLRESSDDLHALQVELEALEAVLRDRMNGPFESLDLSSLTGRAIPGLEEIYAIWKEARKSIEEVKVESDKLLKKAEEGEAKLRQDLAYISPEIVLPDVPPPTLPELPRAGEAANYTAWGQNWINKINATRSPAEAQDVAATYLRSATALRKSLQSSVYVLDELRSFLEATQAVETVLYETGCGGKGCLGRDGYARGSQVPQASRKALKEDLPLIDTPAAARLEKQVRTWEGTLTPQQKTVLAAIDALGGAARTFTRLASDEAAYLRGRLSAVLSSTITAAQTTACVAGTLAPGVNDFADWYEMVEGKDLCTGSELPIWQRALSGVGVIAGSGRLWRTMGEEIAGISKAAAKADDIAETAIKLGWKGSKEALQDLNVAVESLSKTGKLPPSYITQPEARRLGWIPEKGNLAEAVPGKMVYGDWKNRRGQLPEGKYFEADIGYRKGYRGTERMVFLEDGKKVYITNDHYETFLEIR